MEALVVKPRDPCAGRDLEIVEALPVAAVVGQDCLVAMQLGLEKADDRFGHGVVVGIPDGSDRGSQFRSRAFRAVLTANGLTGSMGRVASAGDNAAMESFFSLL